MNYNIETLFILTVAVSLGQWVIRAILAWLAQQGSTGESIAKAIGPIFAG